MSTYLYLTIYILSLPACVWILAQICMIIDEPGNRSPALAKTVALFCASLILALLTTRTVLLPIGAALLSVTVFHITGHWLLRRFGLGIPVYDSVPIAPPILHPMDDDQENGDAEHAEVTEK